VYTLLCRYRNVVFLSQMCCLAQTVLERERGALIAFPLGVGLCEFTFFSLSTTVMLMVMAIMHFY
jgi:hypothetical protein